MTVLSILGTVQRYEEVAADWYVGFVDPGAELVFADGTRVLASTAWKIQGKGLEERMKSRLELGGHAFELRIGGKADDVRRAALRVWGDELTLFVEGDASILADVESARVSEQGRWGVELEVELGPQADRARIASLLEGRGYELTFWRVA